MRLAFDTHASGLSDTWMLGQLRFKHASPMKMSGVCWSEHNTLAMINLGNVHAHTHTRIHVCAYAHACKHGLVRTRASQASSHGTIDAGNFSLCIAPVPSQCVSDKCIGTSNSLYMLRVEWTPLGGSHSKMTKGSWRWAELCSLPLCRPQSAECETNRWCTVASSHCYNAK